MSSGLLNLAPFSPAMFSGVGQENLTSQQGSPETGPSLWGNQTPSSPGPGLPPLPGLDLPTLSLPGIDATPTLQAAGVSQAQTTSGGGSWFSLLDPARVAAGIVGIICIGVGLMMFKQTQTVIQAAGKGAAKVAAIA